MRAAQFVPKSAEGEVLLRAAEKRETCEAFADHLSNQYFFDSMVDDAFWGKNFRAENFFEAMKEEAIIRYVKLTDAETWDYEEYFWNLYQCSEKGLS